MPNKPGTGELPAEASWFSLVENSLTDGSLPGISFPPGAAPGLLFTINQGGIFQLLEGELPLDGAPRGDISGLRLEQVLGGLTSLLEKAQAALNGVQTREVTRYQGRRWEWHFYPLPEPGGKPGWVLGAAFDLSFQEQLWHQGAVLNSLVALRKAGSFEEMIEKIASQLREQLEIDRLALVLGSPPDSPYRLEYIKNWNGDSSWQTVAGQRQLTDPVEIGRLYGGGAKKAEGEPGITEASGRFGFPLIVRDQLLGALWMERPTGLGQAEIRLAGELADMAASALQRARHHQLTERRLERLSALHAIDQAISGNYNLRLTLHIILEQMVSQLDVDAADIILIDPDTLEVTNTEGRGFRHYQPQQGITHGRHDLAWRVLQRRELVALPDLYKESPTLLRGRTFALEGFKSYFGIPLIAKGRILGVMEVFHRQVLQVDQEWSDFLEALGTQAAIAMDNAELVENLRRTNLKLDLAYNSTLKGWVRALALRDRCTGDHTHRVVDDTLKLARAVGIPERDMNHVQRGALLHDIGKLAVPDSILNKEGPLDAEEWELMRRHPLLAREILEPIEFLRPALPIPTSHHERWDGSGYPEGLAGGQIPLEARVFAVLDVWDALRSPRPYRDAWSEERVTAHIRKAAGSHFDPSVVEIWKKVFNIPG